MKKYNIKLNFLVSVVISVIFTINSGCGSDKSGKNDTPGCTLNTTGSYLVQGNAYQLAVSGNYAVIEYSNSGTGIPAGPPVYEIQVIDISDPEQPSLFAKKTIDTAIYGLAAHGNYGYMLGSDYGEDYTWHGITEKIDMTNPDLPVIGTLETDISPESLIFADDNTAYMFGYNTVRILDIQSFEIIDEFGSEGSSYGSMYENKLYVTGTENAVDIFDITDPRSPVPLGSYANIYDYSPHDILALENYAGLACGGIGVITYDVSDPSNIELIEVRDTGGWAEALACKGNSAFLADGDEGLITLDITDIRNPAVTGICGLGGYAKELFVSGNYLYVLDNEQGIFIFDISGLK